MSAISVGVSRVSHNVNPLPELLRSEQNNFISGSLSYRQDSHSPDCATREQTKFCTKGQSDSHQSNSKESKPYPVCAYCQRPIAESYLYRIRGQTWHEGCTTCSVCSGVLTDVCFLHDGRLFCPRDYDQLHATRCVNCRQPMRSHELFMRAEYPKPHPATVDANESPQLVFHVSCFTCCICQQPLAAGDPYTIDLRTNRPICRADYLSSRDASESSISTPPRRDIRSGRSLTPSKHINRRDKQLDDEAAPVNQNPSPAVHLTRVSEAAPPTEQQGEPINPNALMCPGNKRIRTSLTDEQRLHLQKAFEMTSRPSKAIRERLAQELGVPLRVVQVWFQNQRARDKRASHLKRLQIQTDWPKSQPPPNSHPSPTALTPSPRTSVESGSNPEFIGLSMEGMRRLNSSHLSSPKHGDSQPWRPAFLVNNDAESVT